MSLPSVGRPTFEQHREALGIGEPAPRLSFRVDADPGWRQTSYEVEVCTDGRQDRVHVASADSVLVPWAVPPLMSRQRAAVRVRVTGLGAEGIEQQSPWSPTASVEAGLLETGDWSARPVSADWVEGVERDNRPPLLRRSFVLDGEVLSARLYISAQAVFEAEINGARVGSDELSPGWSSYHNRLRYATYDVTTHVREGENAIGAWMGDGWFRGRLGFKGGYTNIYGQHLALFAQLEVQLVDGRLLTVATDDHWRASLGPILLSGLYDGESYDARALPRGWSSPGFDDSSWAGVRFADLDLTTLMAPPGPPVRCTEEVRPVRVWTSPSGRTLVDFGQNLVGRLRITVRGPAGETVTMRHAEVLQDGELYIRPLRSALATDTYVLAATSVQTWEPRFTFHGFRYAEIQGGPAATGLTTCRTGLPHRHAPHGSSSAPTSGSIGCTRTCGGACGATSSTSPPTARSATSGSDGPATSRCSPPTAAFLYDCTGMLRSWLRTSPRSSSRTAPSPGSPPACRSTTRCDTRPTGRGATPPCSSRGGSMAQRGRRVLRDQYPSARAWVDRVDHRAEEDHLWAGDFQLGDWLDPAAPPDAPRLPSRILIWSRRHISPGRPACLSLVARALARTEMRRHYAALAEQVRAAFQARYLQSSVD